MGGSQVIMKPVFSVVCRSLEVGRSAHRNARGVLCDAMPALSCYVPGIDPICRLNLVYPHFVRTYKRGSGPALPPKKKWKKKTHRRRMRRRRRLASSTPAMHTLPYPYVRLTRHVSRLALRWPRLFRPLLFVLFCFVPVMRSLDASSLLARPHSSPAVPLSFLVSNAAGIRPWLAIHRGGECGCSFAT